MKTRGTYRTKRAAQLTGLLLAILFLAIPLIGTLHSHHADEDGQRPTTDQSISAMPEKCLVCEYTAEVKGKQLLMAYPPTIEIPTNVSGTLNTFVYTRIYKFTLQNFSNKGPPALIG